MHGFLRQSSPFLKNTFILFCCEQDVCISLPVFRLCPVCGTAKATSIYVLIRNDFSFAKASPDQSRAEMRS